MFEGGGCGGVSTSCSSQRNVSKLEMSRNTSTCGGGNFVGCGGSSAPKLHSSGSCSVGSGGCGGGRSDYNFRDCFEQRRRYY